MSKRGKIYIIPNENKVLADEFYKEVVKDHLEGINEFSKKYNLGYKFNSDDYQAAPCILASLGHLVVKTEEDSQTIITYIPKTVTDRQNIWIHNHEQEFTSYSYIGAFVIQNENNSQDLKTEKGLDNIIRLCDKRNLFYEKKEDDINARKKI